MHAAFGPGRSGRAVLGHDPAIIGAGLAWNFGYVAVAVLQLGSGAGLRASLGSASQPTPPCDDRTWHTWRVGDRLATGTAQAAAGVDQPGSACFSSTAASRPPRASGHSACSPCRAARRPTIAGVLVSSYWASLTVVVRVLFGVVVTHYIQTQALLRGCMLVATLAAAGCAVAQRAGSRAGSRWSCSDSAFAPDLPGADRRDAHPPRRLPRTANAVGLQVAAAVLGGAAVPAGVGVLAAHVGLEVVGPAPAVGRPGSPASPARGAAQAQGFRWPTTKCEILKTSKWRVFPRDA